MIHLQLVLFQFIVTLVYHAAALSVHAQYSQSDSRSLSHRNNTECPSVWYRFNRTTQDCQCIPLSALTCDGKHAYVETRCILTYDSANKRIICQSGENMRYKYLKGYNVTKDGYHMLLPDNISELNQCMCGPLNRKNYMCSECKSGYGPAIISEPASCSNNILCYKCKDTWYNLLLYLLLQFTPLTVFYLLILVLQVRLTSAPMTFFIMYSQLVVFAFHEECGHSVNFFSQIKYTDTGETLRVGTKILLTIYGVFNLDFFHYILPPFCISSQLKPIHVFFLGYISVFYPFLLILLTWLCVELHGCNFRPVVYLWRPFHRCFVHLRRSWNTKSDLIDAFASFFLLSYSKILLKVVLTLSSKKITYYSLMDGHESHDYAFIADVDMIIKKNTNYYLISTICFTVLVLTCFIIIPTFLLVFYSTKIFRRLLSTCICSRLQIFINIFIEKFHCCYRDGLDGAKDMRSFSGIYFLLRIIVYSAVPLSRATLNLDHQLTRGFMFSAAALLIALCRPYKKIYMNVVDSILLSHTASLCYIIASTVTLKNKPHFFLPLLQLMIALPFIILLLVTAYRIAHGIFKQQMSSMQCFTRLKMARPKLCNRLFSNSHNLTLPETTYGATNY